MDIHDFIVLFDELPELEKNLIFRNSELEFYICYEKVTLLSNL